MRFKISFLLILSIGELNVSAQNFFRSYGNNNDEVGKSAVEAFDTTYMIFGTSSSFIDGTSNFYLMNIDSLGNFKWSKTYGGNNIEQGNDICIKPNRNFFLTGYSNSFGNGYDVYSVEIDSIGNEIWSQTYGGSDWDFAYSNLSLPNGDVLITGNTYSFGNGGSDGFLLKIDNNGDSLWWKNYGTATDNVLRQTILTSTNELVSIGYTITLNGDRDFYLIKTDINGDTVWTKTYGTIEDDEGFSLLESNNGNYILAGYTKGLGVVGTEGYYFEIDTSGNTINWFQTYGGNGDEKFNSITMKPNQSRFYAAWETSSFGNGGVDFVVNSLYTNGGWNNAVNTYGTGYDEKGYDVIFTSHKRVLGVGSTNSPYLNLDVLVIMSDTLLPTQNTMTPYEDVTETTEMIFDSEVILYPQPASDLLTIQSENSFQTFEIFDLSGKLSLKGNLNNSTIDCSSLYSGIYFLRMIAADDKIYHQKIIIARP